MEQPSKNSLVEGETVTVEHCEGVEMGKSDVPASGGYGASKMQNRTAFTDINEGGTANGVHTSDIQIDGNVGLSYELPEKGCAKHEKDLKNVSKQTSKVEASTPHDQREASAGAGRKKKKEEKLVDMDIAVLKEKCRERAMPVTGTREQLLERLTKKWDYHELVKKPHLTVEDVHMILEGLGVENVEQVSCCLKAAIQNKFVNFDMNDPLNQVIVEGKCFCCEGPMKATLHDLLYQPDYAGLDYEDGGQDATVKCTNEDCDQDGQYVTRMCNNDFDFDSGKFHNHCTDCPGFGECIGDYREAHCPDCHEHYFRGLSGFDCPNCEDRWPGGRGGGRNGRDDCVVA